MIKVEFLDLAQKVLDDTFDYYEYQQREDFILIVAIANLHRKPNYWVERIID